MTDLSAKDGETDLWRAVIERALDDALGRTGGGSKGEKAHYIASARAWFRNFSPNFRRVCEWAGLDPVAVREGALVKIALA